VIRIKNKTGGVSSVPSIGGAYDIADDGITADLVAVVDDVQVNLKGELDASLDLRDLLRAGSWVAVDDDGNELGTADSLAVFSPADERALDRRASLVITGSIALTKNVTATLATWPISEGYRRCLQFSAIDIDAPDDGSDPIGALYSGLAKAGRVGAASAKTMGRDTISSAGNIKGAKLSVDTSGNDVRLRLKASIDETITYTIRYVTEEKAAP